MAARYERRGRASTFVALTLATLVVFATPGRAAGDEVRLFGGIESEGPAVATAILVRTELQLERALRRKGGPHELRFSGGSPPSAVDGDLSLAHEALSAGLDQYLDMRMDAAGKRLRKARDLFLRRLGWLGSADPFVRASLYLAMTRLAAGDEGACREVLSTLLRRLPDENLPLSEFPPELADLVDIVRAGLRARSRLTIAATPPGARVIVDGRLRGRAPMTVQGLTEGPHAVRVEAPGMTPWVREVRVSSGTTRQPVSLAPLDEAARPEADVVIRGVMFRAPDGATILAVDRFDGARAAPRAQAILPVRPEEIAAVADEAAEFLLEPGEAQALDRWGGVRPGGAPPPPEASAHLTLSIGGGAGLAEQVSDPGVAPVPVTLAVAVATPLDGGWEALGMMRAQPLDPRAYLAIAGGRYRPDGPDGAWGLMVGGAFGQIAHTITDTETGRPSVAGTVGAAGGAGIRLPLGDHVVSVDLLATTLRPDFTFHVDLLIGAELGL